MLIFIYLLMPIIANPICDSYCCSLQAQEIIPQASLKINSINFDNSDSIIFLGTSGNEDLTGVKITKKALSEPNRVFFDIENAIITFPNASYELKNSKLTQVKIAQNSTNPNIVRIVIWNAPNYDASKIKVLKIKNNIIIKLDDEKPLQQYLTQTYKETKGTSVEYYDKTVIIQEETQTNEADEIFNKVQEAFKQEDSQLVRPNIEQKQARLKSRFFLENIGVNNGNILISGIGVINVEKPFVLTEPNRIVFDFPNTIVLQELRDKEFKLSATETVKIGQFEPSKARIVIKTDTPELYRPIYSTNLQTLLIANDNKLQTTTISDEMSQLDYFKEDSINTNTAVLNIVFSKPIIYSIKRTNNTFNVIIYNLINFDINSFNSVAITNKKGYKATQLGSHVYKISFEVSPSTSIDCYETLNTSQLRFVFTRKITTQVQEKKEETTKQEQKTTTSKTIPLPTQKEKEQVRKPEKKTESPFSDLIQQAKKHQTTTKKKETDTSKELPRKVRRKTVVIDAGHGGNDTGALRGNTLEKDLTLAIALKTREILREKGMKDVVMTRTTDKTLSLADRVDIANSERADIFVSIHINASVKSESKGIETHYYTESGYKVAQVIHEKLLNKISAEDRGLFKSKFYVINHTEAPAVLLELGFISNEQERSLLTSEKRQTDSAEAIAEGIIKYFMEK